MFNDVDVARSLLQVIHDSLSEVATAPGVVVAVPIVAPVLVDPPSTVAPVPVIATVLLVDMEAASAAAVPPSVPSAVPTLVPSFVVAAVKDDVGK